MVNSPGEVNDGYQDAGDAQETASWLADLKSGDVQEPDLAGLCRMVIRAYDLHKIGGEPHHAETFTDLMETLRKAVNA